MKIQSVLVTALLLVVVLALALPAQARQNRQSQDKETQEFDAFMRMLETPGVLFKNAPNVPIPKREPPAEAPGGQSRVDAFRAECKAFGEYTAELAGKIFNRSEHVGTGGKLEQSRYILLRHLLFDISRSCLAIEDLLDWYCSLPYSSDSAVAEVVSDKIEFYMFNFFGNDRVMSDTMKLCKEEGWSDCVDVASEVLPLSDRFSDSLVSFAGAISSGTAGVCRSKPRPRR